MMNRWIALIVRAAFAFYMYVLVKIILFKFGRTDLALLSDQLQRDAIHPRGIVARLQAGNLRPFKEISSALEAMSQHSLMNLLGNIVIFIPFGLFLGLLTGGGRLTLIGAAWRSLAVSLALEGAQAVFAIGVFDVDDLILNTAGGVIGFMVYAIGYWLAASAFRVSNREPAS